MGAVVRRCVERAKDAVKAGATFEMIPPEETHVCSFQDSNRSPTSGSRPSTRKRKDISLGRFDERYSEELSCRVDSHRVIAVVAFANVWVGADGTEDLGPISCAYTSVSRHPV